MSNVTGGETELAVGDTVQLDKGLHIVESVGSKTADCLPLDAKNSGKPRTVNNPFPRHLVVSRGGQPALDEFLGNKAAAAQKPKVKKGFVLLEPGDKLCHGGEMRTVVSVSDKKCVIGNLDGQFFGEDRLVNDFLLLECCTHKFIRLDESQRAANLEQFLRLRKSPQPETETSDATETPHIETMKSTKTKTKTVKQAKQAKQAKESKPKVARENHSESRNGFIWSLLDGSKTKEQIISAAIEKFGGTQKKVAKQVNNAPFYMRKAGLDPKWKAEA